MDPEVFSDVVAGAFPMPDDTELRTIRAQNAAQSIANVACGGHALTGLIHSTALRYDQARYADLNLIAEKGLSEEGADALLNGRVDLGQGCGTRLGKVLPDYIAWNNLSTPWYEATIAAAESPPVTATHIGVTTCLTEKSGGLVVSQSDPTRSFLSAVDNRSSSLKGGSETEIRAEVMRDSQTYVTCTRPYFEAMERALAPAHQQLVERNRELLNRIASELSIVGYVP